MHTRVRIAYPHKSDFKKPGTCLAAGQRAPGLAK